MKLKSKAENIGRRVGDRFIITGGKRDIDCTVVDNTITACIIVRDNATGERYYITWDDPAKFLREVGVTKK